MADDSRTLSEKLLALNQTDLSGLSKKLDAAVDRYGEIKRMLDALDKTPSKNTGDSKIQQGDKTAVDFLAELERAQRSAA